MVDEGPGGTGLKVEPLRGYTGIRGTVVYKDIDCVGSQKNNPFLHLVLQNYPTSTTLASTCPRARVSNPIDAHLLGGLVCVH